MRQANLSPRQLGLSVMAFSLIVTSLFLVRTLKNSTSANSESYPFGPIGYPNLESGHLVQNNVAASADEIDLEMRITTVKMGLVGIQFPHEKEKIRIKLKEEIDLIVKCPNPERQVMLSSLAESFISQFSSEAIDLETLVDALKTFEEVVSTYGTQIKPQDLAYESIVDGIQNLAKLDPKKALLRERRLVTEYSAGKSALIGKVAGAVLAQRIESEKLDGLLELQSLKKDEIRFHAERWVLEHLVASNATDAARSVSYFLSDRCGLGLEKDVLVKLIGGSYSAHPSVVSDVVFEAPRGPRRDAAIVQMVLRMNRNDPDATLAWIDEISDPTLKKLALDDFGTKAPLTLRHLPPPSGDPDPFVDQKSQ